MTKSLAQFKRDIATGLHIEYVQCKERRFDYERDTHAGEWYDVPVPEKLQGVRYVSYVDTTGFYLKKADDKSIRGSFCGFPKADNLAYAGDTFTIVEKAKNGEPYQMRSYLIKRFN